MMVDSRIQDAASLLRERPSEWTKVYERDLPLSVLESVDVWADLVNISAQIRSGRDAAFQPRGVFEVGVGRGGKHLDKGCLFVRFVSEPTVPMGVLRRPVIPFGDVDLMVGPTGLLGSLLPRPIPLVLAEEAFLAHQDSPLGMYLIDPDQNVVEMGWVLGVTQAWQVVRAANARLDGNLPQDFVASPEVRFCMESCG
jgi:hypothetical protein